MKIAILGAGQMGSGMAYSLGKKGHQINLWDRSPEILAMLRNVGESPHLPGIKLQEISVFSDLEKAIRNVDLIILAVPSFAVRELCQKLSSYSNDFPPFLMISKGLEKETAKLPFQVLEEILGEQDILHISGVGYPKEIDKERKVTEVIAAHSSRLLEEFGTLLETHFISFIKTTDLLGAQLAGALKNVMVIAFGMISASEQDPERKKELITKLISLGVKEMKELGKAMGAKEETFEGPAGKGDLELSADSLSRNFRLGENIFRRGIEQVKADLVKNKKTVEGLLSSYAAYKLAGKYGLNLPIIKLVYQVIYEGADAKHLKIPSL